jgi:heme/copper-type cytochrome/quinol oxidase subunit 1
MGSVLLGIGLVYGVIADLTKKRLGKTLGKIHLLTTITGGFGLAFMFTYLGLFGVIRREAIIPDQFMWAMPWLLFFALTVGFGQITFAYNLFKTLGRKTTPEEQLFVTNQEERASSEKDLIHSGESSS